MEPIFHILVPTLTLLALFPRIDRRLVLKLLPLAILPDFDLLVGHRFLFHNVFFVVAVSAAVYVFSKKKTLPFVIALLFLGSHLVLDISEPGVGLFYPLYDRLVSIDALIYTSPTDGRLVSSFDIQTKPLSEAEKDQESPVLTTNGLLLLILLVPFIPSLLYGRKRPKKSSAKAAIS